MLIGRFGNTTGRPYIEGRLIFPRLQIRGDISFLVDTGSDRSLLNPVDGNRLRIDYSRLGDEEDSVGVGGISRNYQEREVLVFSEPRRVLYIYTVNLAIAPPSPDIMDLPTLLGREILDQWRLVCEPTRGILTATVRSADARIPLR